MKRIWIGIGLLLAILVVGLWLGGFMENAHQPGARTLQQAAHFALEKNWNSAEAMAGQARQQWEKKWRVTAAVADHEPMDEIDALFAELEVYAQARNSSAYGAVCAHLASLLEAMGKSHRFSWWSMM